MSNDRDYYIKESIRLSEEAKKSITIPSSIIFSTEDDSTLGKVVRTLMIKKIEECDKHVEHMSNLK